MNLLETELTPTLSARLVPNLFPTTLHVHRIAIIGEAPGRDEEIQGEPFVGVSGRLLTALLAQAGLVRQSLFFGNICQRRPPNNKIEDFEWGGEEIQNGLKQLREDLLVFKPNLCVLLGNSALHAFKGDTASLTYWRGSLFLSPTFGYKSIATYHPAAVLRQYEWLQILALDLRRAAEEGHSSELVPPTINLDVTLGACMMLVRLDECLGKPVSIDIEGGVNTLSCISFAPSGKDSFIVPLTGTDGRSYWDEDVECDLWTVIAKVLADENTPKILQNALYDNFVLSYSYQCLIINVVDDTMFKHWEAYCELPKNLGFLASIYTKQPPWKDDRKTPDLLTFWRYCCTDSAVTYEINERLTHELADSITSQTHYQFNMALLHPILYMELRGLRFNKTEAEKRMVALGLEIDDLGETLASLHNNGEPLNVKSPKQKCKFLYETLGLPVQLHRKTKKPTTNDEAILSLFKKTSHPALWILLNCIRKRTHKSMLNMSIDPDGRIRCSYNALSEKDDGRGGPPTTGRLSCSTSITGSGGNLQTIPEYDRDLFQADDGYYMFQVDLSGADGWTVAAHCARLGDTTMLEDLKYGIKIAKVIAAMFLHGPEISRLPRPELKQLTDKVKKDDPIYFGSKCCQHGTNYGMGKVLLSQTIFIQSEGEVNISASDAERLQSLYLNRYFGVPLWHRWCDQTLRNTGKLTAASGHTRIFFGRRDDHATLKAFLAHEPQANTTYATNLAALKLWTDTDNRNPNGSLKIEPLHQVHDALVGQFKRTDTEWATVRIREYFNNVIKIADQDILIPFEGTYGESWGNLKVGKI